MKGWQAFLNDAPTRVSDVITNGPKPLKEYGSDKLTYKDKQMGIMRFKGGDGRGHVQMKRGMAAVVYYDPSFAAPEHQPIDVPDYIKDLHAESKVLAEFNKL